MYWKKYAQYYLRMWAQIQIRWSHSNFNNNLFRWLGISIILKQKVSFQSRLFTAIDNNCQTQKNGGKVDTNSFHVSYLAWSQEITICQTSSNWAGCIIGKTDIEWLRSLLTSFSSVFHQDSRGILEIS